MVGVVNTILQCSVSFAVPNRCVCIFALGRMHVQLYMAQSTAAQCHLVKDCQSGLVKVGAAKQSKISVSTSLT